MDMDSSLIYGALLAVAVAVLIFAYIEYQVYLLRTDVKGVAGGLRFTAHAFTAEVRRAEHTLLVTCKNGEYTSQPLAEGADEIRTGPLTLALPAAGLRIKVSRLMQPQGPDVPPVPTGVSTIEFTASDELTFQAQGKSGGQRHRVRLQSVPDPVAKAFKHFARGLDEWIDQWEKKLLADKPVTPALVVPDVAKAGVNQPDAVQAEAGPLSPIQRQAKADKQLAAWRESAGFSGSMTEMRFNDKGEIDWLIDLHVNGRIILHADSRHFSGTLKGASVTMLEDSLEIMVRDEYWQEGDNRMPTFKVLRGCSREVLATWRHRLREAMEYL